MSTRSPSATASCGATSAGVPLLITRDGDGAVHAFVNACRHRSARLVSEQSGCQRRFVCPYHAWTYDTAGRLVGVPHQKTGFPKLDRETRGLTRVGCREAYGFVWVALEDDRLADLEGYLGAFANDLEALDLASHAPFATTVDTRRANWKILVEGGIESYHFKVAHRATVGQLFEDNLSTYRADGPHLRSVLARNTVDGLRDQPRGDWQIRERTNLLYTVMPNFQLLVQSDHVIAILSNPLAHDETELRMTTLVPKADHADEREPYWEANHAFTMETLVEDFDLGEGIQATLGSGANETLRFGRFEGALAHFNAEIERLLAV